MDGVTVEEAAQWLGVSPRRVRAMVREGKLEAQRFGRAWAIRRSAVYGGWIRVSLADGSTRLVRRDQVTPLGEDEVEEAIQEHDDATARRQDGMLR